MCCSGSTSRPRARSEEHTSELQSRENLVCRLLLEKKKGGSELCSQFRARRRTPSISGQLCFLRFFIVQTVSGTSSHVLDLIIVVLLLFFFNDTATTEIYTLSLHDALPICSRQTCRPAGRRLRRWSGRRGSRG